MAELTKAEADINAMGKKLDGIIRKWWQAQLKEIAAFKKEATAIEDKINSQDAKLQDLLDSDIAIGTLMTELTKENRDLSLKPPGPPRQNRYNFAERCEMLSDEILGVINSHDFVSSTLLSIPGTISTSIYHPINYILGKMRLCFWSRWFVCLSVY